MYSGSFSASAPEAIRRPSGRVKEQPRGGLVKVEEGEVGMGLPVNDEDYLAVEPWLCERIGAHL